MADYKYYNFIQDADIIQALLNYLQTNQNALSEILDHKDYFNYIYDNKDKLNELINSVIDAALSDTSTNAVQNKVITEAFNNKQDILTFDTMPTEGSINPVTSGGIYDDLIKKLDYIKGYESEIDTYAHPNTYGGGNCYLYKIVSSAPNMGSTTFYQYYLLEFNPIKWGGLGAYGITVQYRCQSIGRLEYRYKDKNTWSDWISYQETLTFDTTPTEGSTNPVTSKGIKSALDLKANQTDLIGKSGTGTNSEIFNAYVDSSGEGPTVTANKASSYYAHAEGASTTASGLFSHAEGNGTTAAGVASHAEGYETTASGIASHTEGNRTTAAGVASHAEGNGTQSLGSYSHTEGTANTAKGKYAHAEGKGCIAGQDPTDSDHLGSGAHAEGRSTKALHNYTHAEGANTEVHAPMSHAEGNTTKVLENAANSHAEGCQTEVSGTSSHAEGHITYAGSNTIPTEHQGTSGGSGGSGSGGSGESGGTTNNALGVHSEGLYTYATKTGAHAEGVDTWALGYGSHSEGEKTEASGYVAHAEGAGAVASGSCSHAEGQKTQATGENSHAEGQGVTANGMDSHAEGLFTIASGEYQHVEGKFNIEDTTDKYAHIVGNGNGDASSANYKSNAHTLDWYGNAWYQGNIKIGGSSYDDTNAKELVDEEVIERIKYYGDKDIIPSDESYFTVNETGETITGLSDTGKTQTELVIPYKINGVEITIIGGYAFNDCTSLVSIEVPNSVTSIGVAAFQSCRSLISINIPNSVTSISDQAFTGTALTSVNIPNGVTTIGGSAFYSCTSLTSINIPNSVTEIRDSAFMSCTSLTSIDIPSSVTSIEDYAFHNCTNLTIYCEQGSYAEMYANTNTIPVMYTDISATDFNNKADKATTISGYGITDAYTKTEVDTKLSTVYKVKGSANDYTVFRDGANHEVGDVYNLQSVYTTSYKTTVDKNAFQYTYNRDTSKQYLVANEISAAYQWLNNAKIKIHTGTDTKTGVLIETTAVPGWELILDDGSILTSDVYNTVTSIDLTVYHDFKVGDNVVYIKGGFWDKLSATVDLSGYATEMELERLKYYGDKDIVPSDESYFTVNETGETITGLSDTGKTQMELVIPYEINGKKITNLDSGKNVTSIFSGNSLITKVVIPNSVTSIGSYAFYDCTSLTSITIPNSVTSIESSAFQGCTSLTKIEIPNSITSIGVGAFNGCTSLTSINIPNSVTNIGAYAFSGCTSLASINIPNSVTSIGAYAFSGCTSLASINIPNSVTSIEPNTFYHCTSLTSINIPNSVTSIGIGAFDGCTSLTSISIPNSVTNIVIFAFNGCTNLTIYCEQGSYAETYANTNNIPVMYTDISATDFNNKADKATTLDGYGITDTYTSDEVDDKDNAIKSDIEALKQKSISHTTSSDYPLTVTDHLEGEEVINYQVYGNSVQDGTPTPDNPIEIQSVGNLVTDETSEYYGKYDVPVVVRGKNLFDGSSSEDNGKYLNTNGVLSSGNYNLRVTDYITIPSGVSSLTFSYEGDVMESPAMCLYDENKTYIIGKNYNNSFNISMRVPSNAKYVRCSYRIVNTDIQLEIGNSATSYEPYSEETKHIYLNEPLRKVGDYADYIDFENQRVVRNLYSCVLTKDMDFMPYDYAGFSGVYVSALPFNGHRQKGICSYIPSYKIGEYYYSGAIWGGVNNSRVVCLIGILDELELSTVDEFKEWLGSLTTPFEIVFVRPSSVYEYIEETITVPAISAPNSAVMNVSSGTATQPSSIDLTYYQDINKKLDEIHEDISNTQSELDTKANSSDLVNYVKFTDYATSSKAGVVKYNVSFGIGVNSEGYVYTVAATQKEIDLKTTSRKPIVPSNLDYAVRSVYPITQTTITDPITVNTIYDLGLQTALTITLPSGQLGDFIQVDFVSGTTATTLTVSSSNGIIGYDLVPEINKIYSLYLDWGIIGFNTDSVYGWRFNYSEYPLASSSETNTVSE